MAIVNVAPAPSAPARTWAGAAAHQFEEDGRTVVCVHGEIDLGTVGTLDAVLAKTVDDTTGQIVVDLARVRFIDAAGLRRILALRNRLAADGRRLTVRNPRGVVLRVLAVLDAEELIEP